MLISEHGCSTRYKQIALRELAIADLGSYMHRFVQSNIPLILTSLIRRGYLQAGPENFAPLISALTSGVFFSTMKFLPEPTHAEYLTPHGIAQLERHGLKPVFLKTGPSDKAYRMWILSMPVTLELVANFLRIFKLHNPLIFASEAVARQFYAALIVSPVSMVAHSILFSKHAPGKSKFLSGPGPERIALEKTVIFVPVLSRLNEVGKTFIAGTAIFSIASLSSVVAMLTKSTNFGMLSAAAATGAILPTLWYADQTPRLAPISDFRLQEEATNSGIALVNAATATEPARHVVDPRMSNESFSVFQTVISLIFYLVVEDQIIKTANNDQDSIFTRSLIFYVLLSAGMMLITFLFGGFRRDYVHTAEERLNGRIPDRPQRREAHDPSFSSAV